MERLASVRWQSPLPTAIDEELVAYDDGTVWLVVCTPRDGLSTIGTWMATPTTVDHAALVAAGHIVVDVLEAEPVPAMADELRTAAIAKPVATARFIAARGLGESVTLAVFGDGSRAVQFELEPHALTAHVERDGATLAWFEVRAPITGFVTEDAAGLGGLGRRAEVAPGVVGAIALDVPGLPDGEEDVAVHVSGWLAEGLPDDGLPRRFSVRTAQADHV